MKTDLVERLRDRSRLARAAAAAQVLPRVAEMFTETADLLEEAADEIESH